MSKEMNILNPPAASAAAYASVSAWGASSYVDAAFSANPSMPAALAALIVAAHTSAPGSPNCIHTNPTHFSCVL